MIKKVKGLGKKLSKADMKKIAGGIHCEPRGPLGCSEPPAGNCSVGGGPGRCCWAQC
ncbi:MAG: hypothetical protein U0U70_13475 [Chitinophagaceae bacterium]